MLTESGMAFELWEYQHTSAVVCAFQALSKYLMENDFQLSLILLIGTVLEYDLSNITADHGQFAYNCNGTNELQSHHIIIIILGSYTSPVSQPIM